MYLSCLFCLLVESVVHSTSYCTLNTLQILFAYGVMTVKAVRDAAMMRLSSSAFIGVAIMEHDPVELSQSTSSS